MKLAVGAAALVAAVAPSIAAAAQPAATYTVRLLTTRTALKAAQAALDKCRAEGYQVAVAVVDRGGLTQVLLRDRYAGPHTVEAATNKAWSAASTRTDTSELERLTRPGRPLAALRDLPRMTALAGGVAVQAGGALLGAIGVSGAPGGEADEKCAKAGLEAIADDLEF